MFDSLFKLSLNFQLIPINSHKSPIGNISQTPQLNFPGTVSAPLQPQRWPHGTVMIFSVTGLLLVWYCLYMYVVCLKRQCRNCEFYVFAMVTWLVDLMPFVNTLSIILSCIHFDVLFISILRVRPTCLRCLHKAYTLFSTPCTMFDYKTYLEPGYLDSR